MVDTALKHVVRHTEKLAHLGIVITEHDELPDVLPYSEERPWLFLIEALASHGPVSAKRHRGIEKFLKKCTVPRIYVTAFVRMRNLRRHAPDIAWETEVWVADAPDHMIHLNGERFLEPYSTPSG